MRTSSKLLLDWVKAWIFTRNVRIDDEVWVWLTTGRELKLATWRCAEEPVISQFMSISDLHADVS